MLDKMLLVDLKTQDFSAGSGIYEVACLVVENYEIADRLYLAKEIPGYQGERIYGFGFYDISENEYYISQFKELLSMYRYPIVAHNCPFDRRLLVYYKWIATGYPAYSSKMAVRKAVKNLGSYTLSGLVKHYKVAEGLEHTAMSDIENVYKILKEVKPQTWLPVGSYSGSRSCFQSGESAQKDGTSGIDKANILEGEVVCFTGKSEFPRYIMQKLAIQNGAQATNSISTNTTMLVVGLNAGSKLDKAKRRGIIIISDEEFMKILCVKAEI
ncbi:MAG: BRCT domain-containing protein [Bacillota bacterium]|nr:BRCT domain-containing protein [Bacillota bacterium]